MGRGSWGALVGVIWDLALLAARQVVEECKIIFKGLIDKFRIFNLIKKVIKDNC